jgi:hypothetical protein
VIASFSGGILVSVVSVDPAQAAAGDHAHDHVALADDRPAACECDGGDGARRGRFGDDALAPQLGATTEAMRRAGSGLVARLLELGFLVPR